MFKNLMGLVLLCTLMVAAETPVPVAGTWNLTYGQAKSTIELTQEGEKLTGKLRETGSSTYAPVTGLVQGEKVQFGVPKELARNALVPQFEGTVSGATMSGQVKVGPARFPFSGTRQK